MYIMKEQGVATQKYLCFFYHMIRALFIQYLDGAELIQNDKTIVLF